MKKDQDLADRVAAMLTTLSEAPRPSSGEPSAVGRGRVTVTVAVTVTATLSPTSTACMRQLGWGEAPAPSAWATWS